MRHSVRRGESTTRRGECWLVDLLDGKGHEQQGRRPCIVVAEAHGLGIVIPLTSNLRRLSFDYTLLIEPDRVNRLSVPSVAMVFQIVSLDDRRFVHSIGSVDGEQMETIEEILRRLLGMRE